MAAVLIIFVVCLIGKDVAFAPAPYVMRGAAQAICFASGLIYLIPNLSPGLLARYWPILMYLLTLLFAAPFTLFPGFVLLQILSLISAVLFAIAYFESGQDDQQGRLRLLVLSAIAIYGITAYASLAFTKLQPGLAYEALFAGNATGYEMRFRGVFSKSGIMAAASGLLVGLAAIRVKRWSLKVFLMIPGLLCLALTQSRSFWLASLLAGSATTWLYFPRLRRWIYVALGAASIAASLALAFNISVDTSGVNSFARLNSISTLSGRTALWQAAYHGWSERPMFGYGFTLGGLGLTNLQAVSDDDDPTQYSRMTLHNGYVQSIMDAGLVGFFFYLMAIFVSIRCILRFDKDRLFPEALYVLVFLSIANGGESVVYSGSVFQSLCFWVFAVFAMHLKAGRHSVPVHAPSAEEMPPEDVQVPWPNLLR
ncbi:MAG: O-antigen ligase family protein [Steroidobacteraceae bacterium]